MASIVLNGDTSGSVTLSPPAVAGTQTVTLPAATGTVMVSGNQPVFSAQMVATSIPNATWTKVTYGTENFDTNNNFASSRFTPTIAGYYQINNNFRYANSIAGTVIQMAIYKNGSLYAYVSNGAENVTRALCVSTLLYCNGSTDYVEIYAYQNSGSTQSTDGDVYYTFSGGMVRSA
jgi:hypothetical protein